MLEKIKSSCEAFPARNAFYIEEKYYTYLDFARYISAIREALKETKPANKIVAVITFNSIETYASIFALWFDGLVFLPVSPKNPKDRNAAILKQTDVSIIISSNPEIDDIVPTDGYIVINSSELPETAVDLSLPAETETDLMYLLFTSGSTGLPKGVPINRKNLYTFVNTVLNLGYQLTKNDRFLQIYDLTFDASFVSYIMPLCIGGCIYTVPQDSVKYLYACKLLINKKITFAKMPFSTLYFLQPYFPNLRLKELKYCLLGGEEVRKDLVCEWQKYIPNTIIENQYGPTEITIDCMYFDCTRHNYKDYKGVLSIGKPYPGIIPLVVDDKLNKVKQGKKGELCIAGNQVTTGYWKNPRKDEEAFFLFKVNNRDMRFYRTGDIVFEDEEGDFMYCGRVDNQVQIQGFRIEMGEIENHAREFINGSNVAAIPQKLPDGSTRVILFVESSEGEKALLKDFLQSKLPNYMMPSEIRFLMNFPQNISGKTDRKKLLELV